MEFRILGPLEVEEDGRPIALGGDKQRSLLALLLLGRGRPVSTERLIEEIWHGEPPATAAKSIQVYATRLRSALGTERVLKRPRGYELVVASGEVDADRFEELVVAASGAPPAEAASCLKEALALWRGHPLADLSLEPWAEAEIARLEERRLAAFEDWADAELALGNHRELVLELEALVAEHPFREQLLERLVLALYRSGRQAESLSAYRRGAARLRSELGLEPSQSLRELETGILRQDESLAAPRAPEAAARRRRSWRLVVAGAGVVVGAAVAAAIVDSTRGARGSLESIPPGVAIVDVARHHPARLVAHISNAEIGKPAEAMKGGGTFWVWRLSPFSMLQVDPRTGREGTSVGSPRGDAGGFLIDGKTIWFSGSRLEHMDIASGRELWSKRLSRIRYDDVQGMARGAGSLWVARAVEGDVVRLDPTTGAVRDSIPVRGEPTALVYTPDGLWVMTSAGIKRIDPATDEVTASAAVPGSSDIAYGGGYVWVSNEVEGTVTKIDGSGQIVHTYETGQGAHGMSYADGTLWVANKDDGTVTGIDAATGDETILRFGHPLQTVAALPGRLLVMVNQGRTYDDRINALRGKVARLIVPAQLGDPDPAVGPSPNPFIFQLDRATCAPLLGYPDAAAPAGQRLVPEVAAGWPSLSYDRRTYTFVVRKGFRFAPPSGAVLDANTFRFSIERALSGKLGPRALGYQYLADLEGAPAFHAGRTAHVAGINVHGNRISFTLVRPSPDFLERLSLPFFCPVPKSTAIDDGGVQGTPPPGAGPYTVTDGSNSDDQYLILGRNPYYGGHRPQRLDAIGFRVGIATDKAIRRVVAGHWDVLEDTDPQVRPGGILAHRFTSGANATGVSYRSFAGSSTLYLALDASRPPFSNPAFRRTLASAIDRRALAAAVDAEPTAHLLPPGVRGGGSPGETASPSREPFAKVSVRLGVRSGGEVVADELRDELAPLGIDVRPVAVRNVERALHDPSTGIRIAALQTEIRFPDPGSFLVQMLGRDVPAAWLPPSTRALVARLHALTGRARDGAAQALAFRLATRDVPVIAYGVPTVGALVGPRLGCRIWNGVDQGFDLAGLCLGNS